MLLVVFRAGNIRYGLDAGRVLEILPAVELRPAPRTAPAYAAGVFEYRGSVVPVLDLPALLTGEPARVLLSTRIILVDRPAADGSHQMLGLLAEHATETISCRESDFQRAAIDAGEAGEFLPHSDGMVERVTVECLLAAMERDS